MKKTFYPPFRLQTNMNFMGVDKIPAHEFWFAGLPLQIKGGSGSPFCGVAFVPQS